MIPLFLLLASPAAAHMALWHPSAYGFAPADRQTGANAQPLMGLTFSQWWFHGNMDKPPVEGWFLDLPAGGTLHAEVACNKQLTTWGLNWERGGHACQRANPETDAGMEHTPDPYSTPMDQLKHVKGCAIAIAYESDPTKVRPEDFVVVTTNFSCPWFKDVDFQIPAGLPECPEGGCHCLWAWNHEPSGGGQEMFGTWLRCKVSGQSGTTPLPKPKVARKCPFDRNNCTVGAKQPLFWTQADGNNIWQDIIDPPYYNHEYGFLNGAQTDLWETGCDQGYATTVMVEPWYATATAGLTTTSATCTPAPMTPAYKNIAPTEVWATKPAGQTFLDTMAPQPTATPAPADGGVLAADPSTPVVAPPAAQPTFTPPAAAPASSSITDDIVAPGESGATEADSAPAPDNTGATGPSSDTDNTGAVAPSPNTLDAAASNLTAAPPAPAPTPKKCKPRNRRRRRLGNTH